jgi:hypothetical protein
VGLSAFAVLQPLLGKLAEQPEIIGKMSSSRSASARGSSSKRRSMGSGLNSTSSCGSWA